jgi:hypothetical protein
MTAVDPALVPAIRAALAVNEVGGNIALAYRLSFAGAGSSGASFGIFQNDCAANPRAFATLRSILTNAKLSPEPYGRIVAALRVPCRTNPLSPADTALVDAALASVQGRAQVDALDKQSFEVVLADLGVALGAAGVVGNSIEPAAQLAIALWCNMSGRPTLLDTWLGGNPVTEGRVIVARPGNPVTLADIDRYLNSTAFFVEHPQDWPHFAASVVAGLDELPAAAA